MGDNINPNVELFTAGVLNLYYIELYFSADLEFKKNKVVTSLTDIYKNKCLLLLSAFTDKKPENQQIQSEIYKSILNYCASKITDPNNKGYYNIDLYGGLKNVNRAIISEIVKEFIPNAYHKMLNDLIEQDYFRIIIQKILHRCNIYIYTGDNVSFIIDKRNAYSVEILQDQFYRAGIAVKNSVAVDILDKNKKLSCKKSDIINQLMSTNSALRAENEKLKNTIRYLVSEKKISIPIEQKYPAKQLPTPTPTPTPPQEQKLNKPTPFSQQSSQQSSHQSPSMDNLYDKFLAPTKPIEIKTPAPTESFFEPSKQIQQAQQPQQPQQPKQAQQPQQTLQQTLQQLSNLPATNNISTPQTPLPPITPPLTLQSSTQQSSGQIQRQTVETSTPIDDSLFDEVLGDGEFEDDDFDEKEDVEEKPKNKSLALKDQKSEPASTHQSTSQQSTSQQSTSQQSASTTSDDVDYI